MKLAKISLFMLIVFFIIPSADSVNYYWNIAGGDCNSGYIVCENYCYREGEHNEGDICCLNGHITLASVCYPSSTTPPPETCSPVKGYWSDWNCPGWDSVSCQQSCGDGIKTRTCTRTYTAATCGGTDLNDRDQTSKTETQPCNLGPCPEKVIPTTVEINLLESGNSACKRGGYASCLKIQSNNYNVNKNWEDFSQYSCNDQIGASGFRAVCSGQGEQGKSGLVISGPAGGTRECEKEETCTWSNAEKQCGEYKCINKCGTSKISDTKTCPIEKGDFNNDGKIDLGDFGDFSKHFGETNTNYDFDGNGKVDFQDFFIFADNFGKGVSGGEMIKIETTLSLSCSEKCIREKDSNGKNYETGSCFGSGNLPFDTKKTNNFLNFGNLKCNSGQSCYCYNPSEIEKVEIVPIGVSDGTQTDAQRQGAVIEGNCIDGIKNLDETDVDCGGTCSSKKCDINKGCGNNNDCESGFCSSRKCSDVCSQKSNDECWKLITGGDNRCEIFFSSCVNKEGHRKLKSKMTEYASLESKLGREDLRQILVDMKTIMTDYNINNQEYNDAINKKMQSFMSTTGSAIKISGRAVKINTNTEGCPDFNEDGNINFNDFFMFADVFGKNANENKKFDLAKDNYNLIGLGDFFKFADYFGQKDVECISCNDGKKNGDEINIDCDIDYGRGCRDCTYEELQGVGINPFEKDTGKISCDASGICEYEVNIKGKYQGSKNLDIKIIDKNGNVIEKGSKNFRIDFKGGTANLGTGITTQSIRDVTSSTIVDISGEATAQESGSKSRFNCGLRLNPDLCCPEGFKTSSDGKNCVVETIRYCADFNNDNEVNFVDFFLLSDSFSKVIGEEGFNSNIDLNKDGSIDFNDFFIFADEFGQEPSCGGGLPLQMS